MEEWKLHVINVMNVIRSVGRRKLKPRKTRLNVGRRKLKPRKTRLNVWVFDGICVPLQKESKP